MMMNLANSRSGRFAVSKFRCLSNTICVCCFLPVQVVAHVIEAI